MFTFIPNQADRDRLIEICNHPMYGERFTRYAAIAERMYHDQLK
jgi:hypothetical protein